MVSTFVHMAGYIGTGLPPRVVVRGRFTPTLLSALETNFIADRVCLAGLATAADGAVFRMQVESKDGNGGHVVDTCTYDGISGISAMGSLLGDNNNAALTYNKTSPHPSLVRVSPVQKADAQSYDTYYSQHSSEPGSIGRNYVVSQFGVAGLPDGPLPVYDVTITLSGSEAFAGGVRPLRLASLDLDAIRPAFYLDYYNPPSYTVTLANVGQPGWELVGCDLYDVHGFDPPVISGGEGKVAWHP